jgi:hypothetical protein
MKYKGLDLEEYDGVTTAKLNDLSGKQVGEFYVICRAPNSIRSTMYWCECSCDRVGKYHASHINRRATIKCRTCAKDEYVNAHFKGHGDISLTYWSDLKHGATGTKNHRRSRRTLKFDISIEQGWKLYEDQDRKCSLSGLPIGFCKIGLSRPGYRIKYQTASLDRIDSTKDYILDNVQWVHKDINKMKNVFTQEEFIKYCELVTKTHI